MPPLQPIKTYVPQKTQAGPAKERGDYVGRNKLPVLIRWFIWLLVLRSVINVILGLTLGLSPESDAANYILTNLDPWPKAVSAEAVFYITALIYAVMAWRWYSRDWRVRWAVMFASGATAAKMLISYLANRAAGSPTPMTPGQESTILISVGVNILICGYLAFYPGMEQAFKETPWD
jgi:hypothetical protein